jgi:AcrR family transcriptional regulator
MVDSLSIKEKAIYAALELSETTGWEELTLQDIADKIGVSLSDLRFHFTNKSDVLVAYGQWLDQKTQENSQPSLDDSEKDRLFELLMERFDIISEHRSSLLSILHGFKSEPKNFCTSLPHLSKSMAWMLELAFIDTSGIKGALKVAGLTIIYLKTLRTWIDDDSEDLSKTMAELDKNLGHADSLAQNFGF